MTAARTKAVYPGSFDPPTWGHVDIIARASRLVDELVVVVAQSSRKTSLFSVEERKSLLISCTSEFKNVKIDHSEKLTVEYAKQTGAKIIVRGLRGMSDFEDEFQMATMNRVLHPEIETVGLMTGEKFYYVASHLVKEVARHGGDLSPFVPPAIAEALRQKFKK